MHLYAPRVKVCEPLAVGKTSTATASLNYPSLLVNSLHFSAICVASVLQMSRSPAMIGTTGWVLTPIGRS